MQPKLPLPTPLIAAHQHRISALIKRFEAEKKLHHALLFTGLAGVGKKEIALHLIQILFCDDAPSAPCSKCKSCKRAQDNQWLDLFWFDPESADEDKFGTHKIETFRELKGKLGFGPTEEPFKVVVISEADRMTPQAANSILKILEEPPQNWIFILTASDSTKILPTLVSRCMEIKLSPLSTEQIYNSLRETLGSHFQSKQASVAARAGMGSLSRAHFFLEDEVWKTRNMILGLLSNPASEWMKLVDQLSQSHRQLSLGLDLLESLLSDLLHERVQGAQYDWIHEDQKEFLIQWANQREMTASTLAELIAKIAENRRYVGMTLNAKLLAQEVLVPVMRTLFS